jgi:CBS domain-containing protein
LGLLRVADVALEVGPVVAPTAVARDALVVAAAHGTAWVALVDDEALVGWISLDDLQRAPDAASVDGLPARPFVATVTPSTPLREALDLIVRSRTRRAAVVDGGTYLGMVTIDTVAGGLE